MKHYTLSLLAVVLFASITFGQDVSETHSASKFDFGLHVGIEKSTFDVFESDWDRLGIWEIDELYILNGMGYRVGSFIRINWKERYQLRLTPGIVFQKNELQFALENQTKLSSTMHPLALDVPFHLVFHPAGLDKIPSFFIGPRAQIGLGSDYQNPDFKLNTSALFAEFGISIAFHGKRFTYQPEVSYSRGLTNLKMDGGTGRFNNAVYRVTGHRAGLGLK